MVLLASAFDQSKYLRAEDLTQAKRLRIKSVTVEMVGQGANQEQKPVVWFTNHSKGLTLNRTNNRTIRGAFGDDMEHWEGKIIEVFPTQAEFRGKLVGALRVRIPPPKSGNGPQPQPQPPQPPLTPQQQLDTFTQPQKATPAPLPEPEPDLAADLDDEIPF